MANSLLERSQKIIAETVNNTLKASMRRWSDAKLDKELCFAMLANDGTPECVAWFKACKSENERREQNRVKE